MSGARDEMTQTPDPSGFRALRQRWRMAPRAEPPLPVDDGTAPQLLAALDADFAALLADSEFTAFMQTEGPRRLAETVAQVARWRRAFSCPT